MEKGHSKKELLFNVVPERAQHERPIRSTVPHCTTFYVSIYYALLEAIAYGLLLRQSGQDQSCPTVRGRKMQTRSS
jgi:hypothetical protein